MRVSASKTDTRIDINQNQYQFLEKMLAQCRKSSYLCIVEGLFLFINVVD